MNRTFARRLTCALLCLMLVVQWIPFGAMAEESESAEKEHIHTEPEELPDCDPQEGPVTAATPTWEYYTNPKGDGTYYAVITAYNGSGGSVTIPNTLGGAKVEGFSSYTFYYSDAAITSLTCGSNLKWFSDVRGLEETLRTVNFSAATIEEIPSSAFSNCEKLTSFSWPKGVKTVDNLAFYNTGLSSVTIPSTVTTLGGKSYGATGGVFEACSKLTTVTINATQLNQISYSTFEDCTALKTVKLSSGITSIGNDAFSGCTSLTTVNWGSSKVTNIGDYAFSDCEKLTSLTLPSTLTTLGKYCFSGTGITSLKLPDSLANFSGTAFNFATNLTELTVNDTNTRYKTENGVLFNKSGTKLICYPAGKASVSKYQIPDGVTTIGEEAFGVSFNSRNIFCGIGNISNLYFPDTVKRVEKGGVAYYSGNFYFCGDRPSVGEDGLGDSTRVNCFYTPGRTGWTPGTKVREWANTSHCTVKGTASVAPTCTVAGGKEISCPICGHTASDLSGAAALGHDWTEWETVTEPSCTENGQRQRTCQRSGCTETETEAIEKLGHKWTSLLCQDDAICTRCDETRAARAHNWAEASCTEAKHCTLCPMTEGEALGHREVIDEAREATCTADGKTEGKHCSRCGKVLVEQAVIPATGHTEVIDPAVPATQHYTGLTEGSHCGTCGTVLVAQKVTPATGSHTKHALCAERCTHEESHDIVTFTKWTSGTFSSGSYYMGADITLSRNLTITGDAHICLNGHTLTFADGYALTVEYGGSLTICDCAGNGRIIRGTLQSGSDGSMLVNRGTMVIYGGTYGPDGHGVNLYNTGTLTIYDGTFGLEISNYYDDWSASTTRYGKTVIHHAVVRSELYSNSEAIFNDKGCTLTVYGGDFSALGYALRNKGTADIRGGTFRSLTTGGTIPAATISNVGRMDLRNTTVTSNITYAIENKGEWNSSHTSYVHGRVNIYDGSTVTSAGSTAAAIRNTGTVNIYGGTVSGYMGVYNYSGLSGTNDDGGKCYISGGTVTGTECAVRNSGSISTQYQNGVPVGTKITRGILEVTQSPNLGKIILEFPKSLSVNYNCAVTIDVELDMDYIALGDTVSSGSASRLPMMNLLNEGYVLLYDYYKGIYLETNHCGATEADDLHWKVNADGKLTIFGTGKMKNYSVSSEQPWNQNKTMVAVTEVVLEPGITHIGSSAFAYMDGLTKIVIPEGVATIGTWVFEGSDNLEEVHLPSTLTSIGRCFFATISGTEPPAAVYYNGCEHQWEKVSVDATQPAPVNPICLVNEHTEDGDCTTALTCSVCDTVIIAAEESHTGGTATCTELAKCSVCGMAYGELGHVAVTVPAVEADCENSGLTEGSCCELCGAVLVEQTVIPASGHTYESVTTPPTCEEAGYTTHTCHCGHEYTDSYTDALGHYVLRPGKELVDAHTLHNDTTYPFVLSNGWYASSNKSSSSSSTFQIRAVYGCTLTLKYKTSTETTFDKLQILVNGTVKVTASGETAETACVLELAAGDTVSIRYSKDTSVSRGADTVYFKIESCTQAELDTVVQIPAEEAEPTCTEAVVCDRCHQTVKPALGHTEVTDSAVEPGCETTGLTEGKHCSACGEILVAQTEIGALGHSFGEYVSNEDATCTTDGTKTAKCVRCDVTDTVPDPGSAKGHTLGEWVVVTAPSCTEGGLQKRLCADCSYVETEELEKLGHHYETVVTAPTCTEPGCTAHTCANCGDSFVDSHTDPLGHDMGQWQTVTEATCEEPGERTRSCRRSGCAYGETEVLQATGHSYEDGMCLNCGDILYILGDFTGDGKVDNADVEYLLWHILFPDMYPITGRGDFTGDGKVDNADVEYLLWHILFPDMYPLKRSEP